MEGAEKTLNIIHFIGYSAEHPADFIYDFPLDDCYLLLLVTTPAQFEVDGCLVETPANCAMLYAPGQKVYYKACREIYRNDWIRFSTTESLVTHFPVTGRPFPVSDPEYCHHLFKLLTWESALTSPDSELIISNLLQSLFLKLRQDSDNPSPELHATELTLLRKRIFDNPQFDWNVAQMARELHLSTGHFQLIYRKTFGVTCMEDVISGRIRMAKDRLIYTGSTILEISEICGYRNVEHFCRQFRKYAGCSPGTFRRRSE